MTNRPVKNILDSVLNVYPQLAIIEDSVFVRKL